jgi:hypothetical protein
MPEIPLSETINSCSYLYLREISEPRVNCLRLLIEEATASDDTKSPKFGVTKLTGLRSIQSTSRCRMFEVLFNDYITFSVTKASNTLVNPEAIYEGALLRIYSKSHFMDSDLPPARDRCSFDQAARPCPSSPRAIKAAAPDAIESHVPLWKFSCISLRSMLHRRLRNKPCLCGE